MAGHFLVALPLAPGGASPGSLAQGPIGITRVLALEVDNHTQAHDSPEGYVVEDWQTVLGAPLPFPRLM